MNTSGALICMPPSRTPRSLSDSTCTAPERPLPSASVKTFGQLDVAREQRLAALEQLELGLARELEALDVGAVVALEVERALAVAGRDVGPRAGLDVERGERDAVAVGHGPAEVALVERHRADLQVHVAERDLPVLDVEGELVAADRVQRDAVDLDRALGLVVAVVVLGEAVGDGLERADRDLGLRSSATVTSAPAGVRSTLPAASSHGRGWCARPGPGPGVMNAASHVPQRRRRRPCTRTSSRRGRERRRSAELAVATVPRGPSRTVSGGAAAIFTSRVATPSLPASSVAMTRIERWPLVSTGVVHGVVQGTAGSLSIAQLNSTPPSGEPNDTLVRMSETVASSAPSIVTAGAAVSTRKERRSWAGAVRAAHDEQVAAIRQRGRGVAAGAGQPRAVVQPALGRVGGREGERGRALARGALGSGGDVDLARGGDPPERGRAR